MAATRWLDDDQQRAWRSWLDATGRLSLALHRGLQASSGLSLSDYEVLVALTDVPDQSLRMFELGDRLGWEKSRVSKQISRMVGRGLVERRECIDDRRGAFVELAAEGKAAIESAAPDHVELVHAAVFDGLDPEQVRRLADFTDTVIARLEQLDPESEAGGSRRG